MTYPRTIISIVLATWALGGCSREPSPEQKQADAGFRRVQAALAQGRHGEARHLLFSLLPVDRGLGRARRVAEELRMLAESYVTVASYDSALIMYQRALEQQKSMADRHGARAITLEIAALRRTMGQERAAFTMYTDAARLANVFNDKDGVREIQQTMLPVCRDLEASEEESQILKELLDYVTAGDNLVQQARVHYEAGLSRLAQHDTDHAIESFLRSLTLAEQAHDSVLAVRVLALLGNLYDRLGRRQESFQAYTEALKRTDITQGVENLRLVMLIQVGDIYLHGNQCGEARRFYNAALSTAIERGNKLAEGYLFVQLGTCAALSGDGEASKNFQSGLELFRGVSYPPGIAYALYASASAAEKAGRFTDAVGSLRSAVEQMQPMLWETDTAVVRDPSDQILLPVNSSMLSQSIVGLLLQLGRYDEAFWYDERQRVRELLRELPDLAIRTRDSASTALLRQFENARALRIGAERQFAQLLASGFHSWELLREVQGNLDRTGRAVRALADRIATRYPSLRAAVVPTSVGLADAQRSIPQGRVLVVPISTRRSLYTYVVTPARSTVAVAAITADRFRELIRDFVALLEVRAANADSSVDKVQVLDRQIQEAVITLYGICVQPIERDLPAGSTLLIVPQRGCSAIPFHALRKSWGRAPLAEQHLVTYLPSVTVLSLPGLGGQHDTGSMINGADVVGLGHPGDTSWDVEYELRDIRAFYKDARLYFNEQATISTLRGERAGVLHLAVDIHPGGQGVRNAYLLLSDGKSHTTTERTLWGKLCTLPAFPTVIVSDLGRHPPGIAPALPYLFFMNGTSAVIINAFKSSRKAKRFFGEQFYTARLAGHTGESAFRQAQQLMMKNPEYSTPALWGSFFLWGK